MQPALEDTDLNQPIGSNDKTNGKKPVEAKMSETLIGSMVAKSALDSQRAGSQVKGYQAKLPEPLPLLPKVTTTFQMPPKCPLDSIRFIQLRRFQMFQKQLAEQMAAGYDLVG